MGKEDQGEGEEDEKGQRRSVAYIWGLVAAEVERGVRPERIVVGGFSQGCAVSLLLGLGVGRDDKPERRVGGIVGLSGYLPWSQRIRKDVTPNPPSPDPDAPEQASSTTKFFPRARHARPIGADAHFPADEGEAGRAGGGGEM